MWSPHRRLSHCCTSLLLHFVRASCLTLEMNISSMRQDALSILSEKTTQHGFFPDGENFSGRPLTEFWRHILSGCQMCDWSFQYHLCSTYRGLWGLVVVRLLWLSGRALAAQARGILGSTPGDCRLFSLSSIFALNSFISSVRQDALSRSFLICFRACKHYITLYKLHSSVSCLYFILAYGASQKGKGEGEKAGKREEV